MKKKKINPAILLTLAFWFLLLYIVAALIWWYIALKQQNNLAAKDRIEALHKTEPDYNAQYNKILNDQKRKNTQYLAEGITFLVIILIGAVFVYSAVISRIRLSQQQQNFMMAVTHELKTPISVAQLNLETLLKHKLSEAQQRQLLQTALAETTRLNLLSNNILLASQIEAGSYKSEKENIHLSELVSNCVLDFQHRYPNRLIEMSVEENISIPGDKLLLQIAINNLIENALKYTPENKPVYIDLAQNEETISLEVIDEGSGITDTEKQKVFEKFYRSGNENTRRAKGTGLGLFIAQQIIKDHGGEIYITDNTPQGSIFAINFFG